jgi:Domain of unknown function (DUF5916)
VHTPSLALLTAQGAGFPTDHAEIGRWLFPRCYPRFNALWHRFAARVLVKIKMTIQKSSAVAIAAAILITSLASLPVHAQSAATEAAPMRAVKLSGTQPSPLNLPLSSPVWQGAELYEQFTENQPQRGQAARTRTQVRVMYDEQALYVGVAAVEKADDLRVASVRHDQVKRDQDFVALYIDAIGDKKAAQFFRVNAQGDTADGLHTADNDNEDFSPDYEFDAVGKKTAEGYEAIFRIPYSSLRFNPQNNKPWRIMVARRVPRDQMRLDTSVNLPREASSFIDALQVLEGFTAPQQAGVLALRPTLTARRSSQQALSPVASKKSDNEFIASLDVKWQPSAELTLDAVLNPDFSQVELDVPQLARNNRFALFLNEKRPVFLESAELLQSPTDALYTRAINDPRWVMRASWRGTALSATALATDDRGGGLVLLPGAFGSSAAAQPANATLQTRVQTNLGGSAGATLGGIATLRRYEQAGADLGSNAVVGLDVTAKPWNGGRLKLQHLASSTSALPNASGSLQKSSNQSGHLTYAQIEHRTNRWNTNVSLEQVSDGYRNDSGFTVQNGVRIARGGYSHSWFDVKKATPWHLNQFDTYVNFKHVHSDKAGQTVSGWLTPGVYVQLPNGAEGAFELRLLSNLRRAPGAPLLQEKYAHAYAEGTPGGVVKLLSGNLDVGQIADVGADKVRPGMRYYAFARLRPHARLELEPRLDGLVLKASGQTALAEHAAQILGVFHIQPQHSVRLIAQRSKFERAADAAAGLAAEAGSNLAASVTYIWRQSLARSLYIGATTGGNVFEDRQTRPVQRFKNKGNEVFVKWQTEI